MVICEFLELWNSTAEWRFDSFTIYTGRGILVQGAESKLLVAWLYKRGIAGVNIS
jgi:hypothetical protein